MAKSVIWRLPALHDLDEIAGYIAEDDAEASERFVHSIWQAAESLEDMAERGQLIPELRHSDRNLGNEQRLRSSQCLQIMDERPLKP